MRTSPNYVKVEARKEKKIFLYETKRKMLLYVGGLELKAANIYVQIHSYTLMMIHFHVHLK
jgi:hypothetical protein